MNDNTIKPDHMLSKMGVLSSFSIAKKINENDMDVLVSKLRKKAKSEKELETLIKDNIHTLMGNSLHEESIPGLIIDKKSKSLAEERMLLNNLMKFSSIIAKKINEKNTDEFHKCFIVNSIVNLLQLEEESFQRFQEKWEKFQQMDNDNNNDEFNNS